jgi:hypothetical protein
MRAVVETMLSELVEAGLVEIRTPPPSSPRKPAAKRKRRRG